MEATQSKLSFLDEALKLHADKVLQPVWVQAAASRTDETSRTRRILMSKRAVDLALISLSAPLWLPVIALTALAVKLDSRGPAFFLQQRTGLNGKVFHIYKFRTMTHNNDQGGSALKQSQKQDVRHTRLGRLLRRTSLDELPQLLNVLKGDMSLIGPRPHARYHDQLFMHYADGYADRFRMRPGLTGWAQVNGQRGLLETKEALQARTDLDNEYIVKWSLWMDVKILFKTALVVVKATNAH